MERNRIVAALAGTTIIVEAGGRSGSIHTATEAKKLGRRVCAIPGPVTSPQSSGSNALIRDGVAELVTCADDLYGTATDNE